MKSNWNIFLFHKKITIATYFNRIIDFFHSLSFGLLLVARSIHSLSTKEGQNAWKSKRKPFLLLAFSVYLCLFCSTHTFSVYKSLNHTSDFAQTHKFIFETEEAKARNKKTKQMERMKSQPTKWMVSAFNILFIEQYRTTNVRQTWKRNCFFFLLFNKWMKTKRWMAQNQPNARNFCLSFVLIKLYGSPVNEKYIGCK